MTHALASREARTAEGVRWQICRCVWMVIVGLGGAGCYQQTVVPPTTSIAPPIRTAPVIPQPVEPFSPPTNHPMEPITRTNPWKPDATLRDWNYIVLHHTAADQGSLESIHEEHLKRKDKNGKHWLGIGYHFVIGNGKGMPDGEIEPTFRWRQQLQGAHAGVPDYNQHGIGIVLIGNFENEPPTEAQTAATKRLVGILKREYGIADSKVVGHGDVKATECPGKLFPMSDVRDSIAMHTEVSFRQSSGRQEIASGQFPQMGLRVPPKTISLNTPSGDSNQ
jgi:hypothetical protein